MSSEIEPPEKKPKLTDNINNIYMETIDKCIEQINSSEKNLQPIISDDLSQPLPLIKVFAGHIRDMKNISRIILILNEKIPLKELTHLKRVCRRDIILCPTTFVQNTSSIQEYIETHVTELKDMFEYFKEIDVPMVPPKVTKQYNELRKIWSCHFHRNDYHEKLVSDNFFSLHELKVHKKYMEVVFEIAKWYSVHKGVNFVVNNVFENVNVTVVVDPKRVRIVTIAYDYREEHPMQHSAMVAIDNVAKTQNGGVWTTECDDHLLPGIEKELIYHLKYKFSQFIIGLNRTNSHRAKGGPKTDSVGEKGGPKSDLCEVKSGPQTLLKKENGEKDGPYLCTGYDIYMLKEPCMMCAMALVHARAKRVFFCFKNSVCGALCSVAKLQTVPSLNHHFEVFSGFL
ncbi:probable inactive tRNA-specific adenosine deaminase-like protein 3 isoform X1 [Maniola jurtina]|uniref:probable inactive tRNA-specific adenosine deaminase-like protein 3 isoform X1 n=1 Tax=Maniola jurtina TaxID=191418 RepID=UPI001E687BE2|nr:probable inactive tRNA-specific adenosine deaminase-like protein 3 isoform X1 [Maniola jurtina]